jgi:prolyl oligopeptidase
MRKQIHAPQAPGAASEPDDPYLWLEETYDPRALAWVAGQNAITRKAFLETPEFDRTRGAILDVLDSEARIPYVRCRDGWLYNFWQDRAHPRGLWRRTTLDAYVQPDPRWQVLLDVDALNRAEGRQWVFAGAQCLPPRYARALVSLSPDGGDAVEIREFDLASGTFVADGFRLPAAKTEIGWIDVDHVFVATDFGAGSMTKSSYPRIVKRWARGTPLAAAEVVHEADADDLAVAAWRDHTPGFKREFVAVQEDFFHSVEYLLGADGLVRIEVPGDAEIDVQREWLLVETRSPWTLEGTTWPAGALVAIRFDDFMAGRRDFTALFTPDARTALAGYSWTRHHLILELLHDVQGRMEILTPPADGAGAWVRQPMPDAPRLSSLEVVATDPDRSDEYWLTRTGFLEPTTLARGVLGEHPAAAIKQAPAFFDATRFAVAQHFATSADGTRVPYFEIAPRDLPLDGTHRVLAYGYGGFEVSLAPAYSGTVGRSWLARGGVYVVANIRGGGEYGPPWHQAALKANRRRAYEDFAAVARDLIRRGVTSPAHLGAEGGSNGGLLVGNLLTRYPELFGALVCEVPLLDLRRYTQLAAGASWIAEYGDPDDPAEWAFLKAFSPYHNVTATARYPAVLFYTATSDNRVGPAQARKLAAKMQALGHTDVWFFEQTEGGHGGGADHAQVATMHALASEFLWQKLA